MAKLIVLQHQQPQRTNHGSEDFFDFTKATLDQFNQIFIPASYKVIKKKSPYIRAYNPSNVNLSPAGLQLTCSTSTDGTTVPSAGIFTRSRNFFYGSYRAEYHISKEPGTVAGFFHYKNDTSEIDVEYISANSGTSSPPPALQYSVKPQQYLFNGAASKTTMALHSLNKANTNDGNPGVPSDWSFVWTPDAVHYGPQNASVITTNVPQAPGRIMLNHWSDGDAKFSKGPPERDSVVTVKFLQAVYNDTEVGEALVCQTMQTACLVEDGVVRGQFARDGGGWGLLSLGLVARFFWSRGL
ncbi:uncharacterized protein RCC_06012 [Ramularia collo-cygni]|uniref:GH16 domain-containing protein n=1 Tax=Ramularia collo-cygni TaxID=112498 RepID=A0A2D3V0A8_9PEZI|nr:uncharacterized protein RCC_06012 [Ramularia collo-cygni]CZT20155.1 uncharacterized protein RCC_06012 [Ramularia collo-cygni]